MTVEEAIGRLKAMPPESMLLRGDNSGGYEMVVEIRIEEVEEIQTQKKTTAVVID